MSRISAASVAIGASAKNIQPVAKRRERIAQFVRQGGQEFVLAAVGFLQRLGVCLEFVALRGDLLSLPVKLEKDVRLAAQNVGFDRLLDEIDGAGLVAAKAPLAVGVAGRHEDDRNAPRAFVAAHQLGQLEAVHAGHLHVDQRQRHVVLKQKLERLVAGARLQQHEAVAAQQAPRATGDFPRDRRPAESKRDS